MQVRKAKPYRLEKKQAQKLNTMVHPCFALLCIFVISLWSTSVKASSTSSRCVEGYYFSDGWCLGIASTSARPSFNEQFRSGTDSYCKQKYPHAADIQPAVLRHPGQVAAMKKILNAGEATSLLTGWIPFKYSDHEVRRFYDQTTHVATTKNKLNRRLGEDIYTGSDCSGNGYSSYSSYSGDYEYYDYEGYTDYYTDYSTGYSTDNGGDYSYSNENMGLYFYSSYSNRNDPYTDTHYSKPSAGGVCYFPYPLAMKGSGDITVVDYNRRSLVKSKPPVCMYEVPARDSAKTCGNLLATKGYCLFKNPLDTRKTKYDGDWSQRDNISEYNCYKTCLSFTYCKAYEFYGASVESGTCEMHFQEPTSTKLGTDAANLVRKCVVLAEPTECNGHTPEKPGQTPKPTPKPTSFPTMRPTNMPTSRPTKQPTSRPTERPTKRPTERPTSRPTGYPTARPTPAPISYWSGKCKETKVVELETDGEWITLGTNLKKPKYRSNTDLCWLIRAPKSKFSVTFRMVGGVSQADKDVMKVYDVDSSVSNVDTFFDDLRKDSVGLTLRESYSGKVNGVSELEPQARDMLVNFYSDKSKRYSGLVFEVTYFKP